MSGLRFSEEWYHNRIQKRSIAKAPGPQNISSRKSAPPVEGYCLLTEISAALTFWPCDPLCPVYKRVRSIGRSFTALKSNYEAGEQCLTLLYFRTFFPELAWWISSIPNSGKLAAGEGGKLVGEGLSRGYPDLLIDLPSAGYIGARFEMKRYDRDARATKEQMERLQACASVGHACAILRGHRAAILWLHQYFKIAFRIDRFPWLDSFDYMPWAVIDIAPDAAASQRVLQAGS